MRCYPTLVPAALLLVACTPQTLATTPPAAARASSTTRPAAALAASAPAPAPPAAPVPSAASATVAAAPLARARKRRVRIAEGYEASVNGLAIRPDDHVVVTGYYRGENASRNKALPAPAGFDAFLAELDADGQLVWQRGCGAAQGQDIALAADGRLLLTGEYVGSATFGGTLESRWLNVFAASLDARGEGQWVAGVETRDVEHARVIAAGPGAEVVLAGQFFGFGRPGTDQLTTKGGADAFVAAFDGKGRRLYRTAVGTTADDDVSGLAVAKDGSALVTGFFNTSAGISFVRGTSVGDTSDGFVARVDREGKLAWTRRFGGAGRDGGTAAVLDAEGRLHVAGVFQGEADLGGIKAKSAGVQDVFVAEVNDDGSFASLRTFEGPKNRAVLEPQHHNLALMLKGGGHEAQWLEPPAGAFAVAAMAVHPSGAVALGGWFYGQARFGEQTLVSEEDADAFVVLLDPAGNVVFADRLGGKWNDIVHDLAFDGRGRLVVAGEAGMEGFVAWYE